MFIKGYNDYTGYIMRYGIEESCNILNSYIEIIKNKANTMSATDMEDEILYIEGAKARLNSVTKEQKHIGV